MVHGSMMGISTALGVRSGLADSMGVVLNWTDKITREPNLVVAWSIELEASQPSMHGHYMVKHRAKWYYSPMHALELKSPSYSMVVDPKFYSTGNTCTYSTQ